jgi:hypothetical protein
MKSSRVLLWIVVVLSFAGGVFSILASLVAFADIVTGHGGGAGNFLQAGFGSVVLFVGICLLVLGVSRLHSLRLLPLTNSERASDLSDID